MAPGEMRDRPPMPTEPIVTDASGPGPGPTQGLDMSYIGPDPQAATAPAAARPKAKTGLWVAGGALALLAVKVGSVVLHLGVFAHLFNMWPHPGK